MAIVGTFCILLVVLTTIIHYEVLRILTGDLPTLEIPARTKLLVVIFGAFFAHAVEIFLYAVAFYVFVRYLGAGPLGHLNPSTLTLCLYFSGETYTSLGYGDIIPRGELRLLAGVEALNGLLLIGWSASFIYIAMERFWHDDDKENAGAQPGACSGRTAINAPLSYHVRLRQFVSRRTDCQRPKR